MFDSRTPLVRSLAMTFGAAGAAIAVVGISYAFLGRHEIIPIVTGILVMLVGSAVYAYLHGGFRKNQA